MLAVAEDAPRGSSIVAETVAASMVAASVAMPSAATVAVTWGAVSGPSVRASTARRSAAIPGPDSAAARPLARCSAGGYDLSEGMVYTGWALMPPAAEAGAPIKAFENIQINAAEKQRGLWKGSFVKPWEWREGTRLPLETQ